MGLRSSRPVDMETIRFCSSAISLISLICLRGNATYEGAQHPSIDMKFRNESLRYRRKVVAAKSVVHSHHLLQSMTDRIFPLFSFRNFPFQFSLLSHSSLSIPYFSLNSTIVIFICLLYFLPGNHI